MARTGGDIDGFIFVGARQFSFYDFHRFSAAGNRM